MSNIWQDLPRPFLVLAPMEDVTDFVFRQIIIDNLPKPDVFFTEFTSSDGLFSKGREEVIKRFKYSESHRPIIAQIWGINPQTIYQAAKLARELQFDGVDINMGCPVHAIVSKGAGAAMCQNPSLAGEVIAAAKDGAKNIPVSVKTRLGYDKIDTQNWIGFLLEQKIAALTVHGRTAVQMSTGDANWEEIGKVVQLNKSLKSNTIIIGNGDIKSREQAMQMHEKYRVDGVMIGRGIFSDPWIFSHKSTLHSKEEYLDILLKHVRLYEHTWGQEKSFDRMKKFFKMYIKDFKGANKLRQKLMECKNREQIEEMLLS